MTIDANLNIVCNLDFSLQYLYSRDEIEAGILWKMEICFIVDSELMSFLFCCGRTAYAGIRNH